MEKRFGISDAARQVGVEAHVLRYWEDELGLAIPRNGQDIDTIESRTFIFCIRSEIGKSRAFNFVLLSCFCRIEDESRR